MDDKQRVIAFYKLILNIIFILVIIIALLPFNNLYQPVEQPKIATNETVTPLPEVKDQIIDGKDVETGLIVDDGWELVKSNCTRCHNSKIILQNHFTKEGWKELIVWMQETQGLWKLGENEDKILDYLAKNYAPKVKGRRVPIDLKEGDWYILE